MTRSWSAIWAQRSLSPARPTWPPPSATWFQAVRAGGAFAAFAGTGPVPLRGIRVVPVTIHADGAALTELSGLAAAGKLTLRVAGTYPLAEAATAHQRLQAGGVR